MIEVFKFAGEDDDKKRSYIKPSETNMEAEHEHPIKTPQKQKLIK